MTGAPASPLLRYAAVWLAAGAAAATAVVVAVGGGEPPPRSAAIAPLRQVELGAAARRAGCELRRDVRGRANPPVRGGAGAPRTPAGVFDRPPGTAGLLGAMRRGVVVLHHRPDLPAGQVDELRRLHAAVPAGTIVAPNGTGMRYAVAATAYRRLLGCPRYTRQAVDAVRLFRGRYLGSRPPRGNGG